MQNPKEIADTNARDNISQKHDQEDLIAQKLGSQAAHDQAVFALPTLIVGGVGTFSVIIALMLTFWANRTASKTYSAFTRVEDANLVVSYPTGYLHENGMFFLNMSITNIGRSAAIVKNIEVGDGDPVIMVSPIKPNDTLKLDQFAPLNKRDVEHHALKAVIIYETALHPQVELTVNASVLNGKGRGDYWGLVGESKRQIKKQKKP